MSVILSRPRTEHHCLIGHKRVTVTQEEADHWNADHGFPPSMPGTFIVDDLELRALPGGSVVECEECGKVWVKNPVEWQHDAGSGWIIDNSWRPEKKRERKRRERSRR